MSKFLSQTDYNFEEKTALVRIDCDVDLCLDETCNEKKVDAEFRLEAMLPTIHFLQRKKIKKIIMIGHMGRPGGKEKKELTLQPIADWFTDNVQDCQLIKDYSSEIDSEFSLMENLRFHAGERDNSQEFVQQLASLADVYINDAFATAHRKHASIYGVPQIMDSFLGLRMEEEIKTLRSIKDKAKRPLVFVLGGSKPGKLDYVEFLAQWVDKLLIGGKHPQVIPDANLNYQEEKVILGQLKDNGKDLTQQGITEFKHEIKQAQTIIWAGPMGVYEEKENRQGTMEIARTIAQAKAFKLAGGGDTHTVLDWLNMWDSFDFISTGGGAMLQYLKQDTLPAIEVIE
jgi:phosphoglycerate kinase